MYNIFKLLKIQFNDIGMLLRPDTAADLEHQNSEKIF